MDVYIVVAAICIVLLLTRGRLWSICSFRCLVAAFQWIERIAVPSIVEWFAPIAESLDCEVVNSVSHHSQLYAVTPLVDLPQKKVPVVTVLISWSDRATQQVLIEVRSDEPMLRSNTCCEQLAQALKRALQGDEDS